MVKYQLRVHVRDVRFLGEIVDAGNHTGYDLIIDNNGIKTIQYIDLYQDNGKINFYISEEIPAREYLLSGGNASGEEQPEIIIWGTRTFQNNEEIETTADYLREFQAQALEIANSDRAVEIFNKIRLEATLLRQLTNKLDYNKYNRNCNTCTNYFAQQYLNGQNVFADLPDGRYVGREDSFYNPNSTDETDVTIKAVREILDKYYSLVGSNVDLAEVNYEVVNQSNGWYAKFSTDDYNYVFVGNGDSSIINGNDDSIIYLGSGHNVLNSGSGNNIVYGGENIDSITLGDGENIVYSGNGQNYIHTGNGNDNITGGNGKDIIYAGDGINIIDAGSGNNEMHGGNAFNSFRSGSDNDTVWSYNTTDSISLGAGNNTIHLEDNKSVEWEGRGRIYVSATKGTVDTIYGYDIMHREIICYGGGSRKVYDLRRLTVE